MAIQKNFVIKNGLEVNSNLIFADTNSNKVGIATTSPQYTLHVNGGIGATSLNVTGVSTVNSLSINGTLSVGNSTGTSNQYLASIGTGVTWKNVVVPRTSTVYSAGIGSTSFSASYSVGLIDVYINGVRLVPPPSSYAEFTASNGTSILLNDPCFGGEIVELVVYNSL
jgi:hypothetical protein